MNHAIPYSLVIGKDIIKKEGETFLKLYNGLSANKEKSDFRLIDAEAANSGLQMLRELKQGRSLLLYIDGNLGAGAQTAENNNCCLIDFLHQQIHARKGISFLAHAAKVPLLITMSHRRTWDNIRLKFFEPIIPPLTKDRLLFAEEATQGIYNLASSIIQEYPEQWEAWLYIHKVAKIIRPESSSQEVDTLDVLSGQLSFNPHRFGILKMDRAPYLFSKYSYSFYPITNKLFDFLTECNLHPVKNENIDGILINELLKEGVLVTVK